MAESRRKEFFPEVTDEQWNDWKWQVKNRIGTVDQLKKYLDLDPSEEEGIRNALKMLRMATTPYYLSLIDKNNPHCLSANKRFLQPWNYTKRVQTWKTRYTKTAILPYRD